MSRPALARRATVVLASMAFTGCAERPDPVAEEAALREVSARYLEMARAGDAAGIAGLFLPDGAWYPAGVPSAVGAQAVEAGWAEDFAFNPPEANAWTVDRFDVAASADLAVEHGSYQSAGGSGRYLTVYRKQDGAWKIASDMAVSTAEAGGAPEWAREGLASWYEAYNGQDAERLVALYASDAVTESARGRTVGRAAIAAGFRQGWADGPRTCSGGFDGFTVVGAVATGWGRDTCEATNPADGSATTARSRWITVYERQADGSWLIIRDIGEPVGQ